MLSCYLTPNKPKGRLNKEENQRTGLPASVWDRNRMTPDIQSFLDTECVFIIFSTGRQNTHLLLEEPELTIVQNAKRKVGNT